MPTINDPNGSPMGVMPNGFSLQYAAAMDMPAHAGDDGEAFSVMYAIDPNIAGDIIYIKNLSDKFLRIYHIKAHTDGTGGLFTVKTGVTGTPTTPTDVTPINALVGSGNPADGTFQINTTGASLALTGGNTFDVLKFLTGIENTWLMAGELALDKNQTMVIANTVDPTAIIYITIYFYFHDAIVKP